MARFFRREKSKVTFAPTLTSQTSPTVTELNAATPLDLQMADISGFNFQNSPIATPDFASSFTPTIPGEDTAGDPTIVFYDDDTAVTIRTALAKGTAGFVVLCPYGRTATKRCEVWPVISTGYNDQWTAGNEAAKAEVKFAVTAAPKQASTLA